jgi:coenzyme F420-reducing hydrogenase delta subunit
MPGDCHYLEGNANAKRRIEHIRALLGQIGLEPDRVRMYNLSSAMASQFVAITQEMAENIRTLGKNPLRNHNAPISKLESGK